jgi:hypothetical protein
VSGSELPFVSGSALEAQLSGSDELDSSSSDVVPHPNAIGRQSDIRMISLVTLISISPEYEFEFEARLRKYAKINPTKPHVDERQFSKAKYFILTDLYMVKVMRNRGF